MRTRARVEQAACMFNQFIRRWPSPSFPKKRLITLIVIHRGQSDLLCRKTLNRKLPHRIQHFIRLV